MTTHSIRLARRLRALQGDLPLLGLWFAAVAAIEVYGRRSTSEAGDLLAVLSLATLGAITVLQHAARPRVWLELLVGTLRTAVEWTHGRRVTMGIDLRGDPPLPRRLPPFLVWGMGAGVGLLTVAWTLREALPGTWRGALQALSPTLLALYHAALWIWLGLAALVHFLVPLALFGEALERSPRWRARRWRMYGWIGVVYAFTLVTSASALPVHVPLILSGLLLVALIALLLAPDAPRITLLWKQVGAQRRPAAFQWTWLFFGMGVVYLSVTWTSVLLAAGDRIPGPAGSATPISHFLGAALAWSIPGAFVATFHQATWMILRGHREGTSRRPGPRVCLEGPAFPEHGSRATAVLRAEGFEVVGADVAVERTDVRLRLVDAADLPRGRAAEGWPRPVSVGQLEDGVLTPLLRRRFEHLCRRAVARGIERALAAAAERRFERGSGFWIAPHFPFVPHLTRDVDETADGWIGQPWRKLIPYPAREHLRRVLAELELDLCFVEDGVRSAEFNQVLARLYEHHATRGPGRLDDVTLFGGLPRLRVVVHDYVLEHPYRATGYPETDYEHLGRARILHVYRDRGGDEDVEPTPVDFDWLPSPLLPASG